MSNEKAAQNPQNSAEGESKRASQTNVRTWQKMPGAGLQPNLAPRLLKTVTWLDVLECEEVGDRATAWEDNLLPSAFSQRVPQVVGLTRDSCHKMNGDISGALVNQRHSHDIGPSGDCCMCQPIDTSRPGVPARLSAP